jgi:hypothetical protein
MVRWPETENRDLKVIYPVALTTRMRRRLKEIAKAPPPSSLSAVVRYLFDIGINHWQPVVQEYSISLRELATYTKIPLRRDQVNQLERIREMGYSVGAAMDIILRIGDMRRGRRRSAAYPEEPTLPDTGFVPEVAEGVQPADEDKESDLQVPPDEESDLDRSREELAAVLRNYPDLSESDDSGQAAEDPEGGLDTGGD